MSGEWCAVAMSVPCLLCLLLTCLAFSSVFSFLILLTSSGKPSLKTRAANGSEKLLAPRIIFSLTSLNSPIVFIAALRWLSFLRRAASSAACDLPIKSRSIFFASALFSGAGPASFSRALFGSSSGGLGGSALAGEVDGAVAFAGAVEGAVVAAGAVVGAASGADGLSGGFVGLSGSLL